MFQIQHGAPLERKHAKDPKAIDMLLLRSKSRLVKHGAPLERKHGKDHGSYRHVAPPEQSRLVKFTQICSDSAPQFWTGFYFATLVSYDLRFVLPGVRK